MLFFLYLNRSVVLLNFTMQSTESNTTVNIFGHMSSEEKYSMSFGGWNQNLYYIITSCRGNINLNFYYISLYISFFLYMYGHNIESLYIYIYIIISWLIFMKIIIIHLSLHTELIIFNPFALIAFHFGLILIGLRHQLRSNDEVANMTLPQPCFVADILNQSK